MKDFLDGLDDRLMAIANDAATQAPEPSRRRLRRPAILGALTATLAGAGTIFALGGTSLAELPILTTPTTDVGAKRAAMQMATDRGVDFSKAHTFGTPNGPGFVLTSGDRNAICVSIPDAGRAAGAYGSSCSGPVTRVERTGLAAELTGDRSFDPSATTVFAFVLPQRATHVRLNSRGTSKPGHTESGVVVASIVADTTVSWTVDGKPGRRTFSGPFAAAATIGIVCPGGRLLKVPNPAGTPPIAALRKRACS